MENVHLRRLVEPRLGNVAARAVVSGKALPPSRGSISRSPVRRPGKTASSTASRPNPARPAPISRLSGNSLRHPIKHPHHETSARLLSLLLALRPWPPSRSPPVRAGELFVDEFLVAEKSGVSLKLNEPVKREIVLTTDQPWEGKTCAYFSVIQDGAKVLMYYAARPGDRTTVTPRSPVLPKARMASISPAEARADRGGGTKDNNVIWRGVESHNFSPFLDANPKAKPEERYKALGGVKQPARTGTRVRRGGTLRLRLGRRDPLEEDEGHSCHHQGGLRLAEPRLLDTTRDRYVCFSRIFSNKVRAVQATRLSDFLDVDRRSAAPLRGGSAMEHFYTSATVPCPTAPHLFLSFPSGSSPIGRRSREHEGPGVSDAVFMSSRDGVNWDRPFLEAWVRPGRT